MASTTGNDIEFAKVLANGEGNLPDADEVMANFDKVNDKIWISITAPSSPYNGQIWYKYNEDSSIALRIYNSVNVCWYAIPLMIIE
jgi:hypothetical protein